MKCDLEAPTLTQTFESGFGVKREVCTGKKGTIPCFHSGSCVVSFHRAQTWVRIGACEVALIIAQAAQLAAGRTAVRLCCCAKRGTARLGSSVRHTTHRPWPGSSCTLAPTAHRQTRGRVLTHEWVREGVRMCACARGVWARGVIAPAAAPVNATRPRSSTKPSHLTLRHRPGELRACFCARH